MANPRGTHFVISANLLATGAPCWRRADGNWSDNLQQAHAAATEAERDAMLAAAGRDENVVADPYAFPVCVTGGCIDPLTAREEIRAKGPSVACRRADREAPLRPA